ncbi:hypothetical protein RRL34_004254 [Vibrio parahaemolyticus]|nr:hypothetical protein [Vibrio parahaemolyticus]
MKTKAITVEHKVLKALAESEHGMTNSMLAHMLKCGRHIVARATLALYNQQLLTREKMTIVKPPYGERVTSYLYKRKAA